MKFVKDNEKFWKRISPLFSNKIKSKEKITLVEDDEIISSDTEVAKTFQNFSSSIVKNLNIQKDETHLSKTTQYPPLFSKLQCRFCKGHSTKHCLLVLIEKVLDKRGFAGLLLTDLSKAFDCIDHELIIAKLHAYGLSNLFPAIFMTKSKELKLTLHLVIGAR